MENTEWTQITARGRHEDTEAIEAVMSMLSNWLMTEDYADIERDLDGVYGDLIDEELLARDRTVCAVSAFVPATDNPAEHIAFAREHLAAAGIDATLEVGGTVRESDWADQWKKYYKPIHTGKQVVIVPVWEEYEPRVGEKVVLMDPGMAFGTGTHETTRLCAAMLEDFSPQGKRVLDVGCGSAILAIAASKLGCESAYACDIDPQSVRVARHNCEINGTDNVVCAVSDLVADVPDEKYDIILANIVADIIIRLAPDAVRLLAPGGVMIVSGIITGRADEVRTALTAAGYEIVSERTENGWLCAAVKVKEG